MWPILSYSPSIYPWKPVRILSQVLNQRPPVYKQVHHDFQSEMHITVTSGAIVFSFKPEQNSVFYLFIYLLCLYTILLPTYVTS